MGLGFMQKIESLRDQYILCRVKGLVNVFEKNNKIYVTIESGEKLKSTEVDCFLNVIHDYLDYDADYSLLLKYVEA